MNTAKLLHDYGTMVGFADKMCKRCGHIETSEKDPGCLPPVGLPATAADGKREVVVQSVSGPVVVTNLRDLMIEQVALTLRVQYGTPLSAGEAVTLAQIAVPATIGTLFALHPDAEKALTEIGLMRALTND